MVALILVGAVRTAAAAQQAATAASLVFDGVTVVDVEQGKLIVDQRVVIADRRIHVLGGTRAVKVPAGAQVVDARGKYLIPGLWDLHTHPGNDRGAAPMYALFIANGVTGIRNASTDPQDTFIQWRREILAGTRLGPPRQILASVQVNDSVLADSYGPCSTFARAGHARCLTSPAEVRQLVDSLKAVGADMIKTYILSPSMYFALAAEARRIGIPFGGHDHTMDIRDFSDSGASILDHINNQGNDRGMIAYCLGDTATLVRCRSVAEQFRKNGTWWVPTLLVTMRPELHSGEIFDSVRARYEALADQVQAGSVPPRDWLHGVARAAPADSGLLTLVHRADVPLLTGTDVAQATAGFALHAELAALVLEGLSPLQALQAATLNPAELIHATDSLGTVATGKLADLVLLDANPLADITNTTLIHAVIANGRYFDRSALDQLVAEAQAEIRR